MCDDSEYSMDQSRTRLFRSDDSSRPIWGQQYQAKQKIEKVYVLHLYIA